MEEMMVKVGFGITCFFFMCMFLVGSEFFWGALVGLVITGVGWMFWRD